MEKLETNDLFSSRDTVREAMQFVDDILQGVSTEGGDRLSAYTAVYVLYNTVVEHYGKQEEDKSNYWLKSRVRVFGEKKERNDCQHEDYLEEGYHGC